MAKIGLTKLGLKVNQDIKTIEYNGQLIEIKQYISINEKLRIIGDAINLAQDDNNFSNPIKLKIFLYLEIIQAYTNINLTEKQKEDSIKLYDLFESNNLFTLIFDTIPTLEINEIIDSAYKIASLIYDYKNSLIGILDTINNNSQMLNFDLKEIQDKLSGIKNEEGLELIQDILKIWGKDIFINQ